MPIVTIQVTREGTAPGAVSVTPEQKAALIKGASQLLLDVLNKPLDSTFVVIDEVELENWGWGGPARPRISKEARRGSRGKHMRPGARAIMLRPSPWASIAARRCRPKGLWVPRPEDVREGVRHGNGRSGIGWPRLSPASSVPPEANEGRQTSALAKTYGHGMVATDACQDQR
jgi:4-oxalocrotonate tautomerase